nr:MAG TPA_asm: hypothetical protein [Caudoviricetes sp.]
MSFIDFTCLSVKQLRMTIFAHRIKLRYRHGKDNEKGAAEERCRTTEKRGISYTQEHIRHHLRMQEAFSR